MSADVEASLDRRLDPASSAPLGLALSGGGDSAALLALAVAWTARHGRRLIAFTVDHGLNPDSARWTAFAGDLARRFGAEPVALAWTGPKPSTGLPAAARAARHGLIAEAARGRGCRVVLFAHTADDVAEGDWMRARGTALGALKEWAPSPAWPEGREVFLLRPLLEVRRDDLRRFLAASDVPWLDDPANDDPRFLRTLARSAKPLSLKAAAAPLATSEQPSRAPPHPRPFPVGGGGRETHLVLDRAGLGETRLSAALLCASGGVTPPRGQRLRALLDRLADDGPVTATLAGARVEAGGEAVLICREQGRGGLPGVVITPGEEPVWDGRWLVATPDEGVTVRALGGVAARLGAEARRALAAVPPPVRPTLPAFVGRDGAVSCPVLEPSPHAARSLVRDRFDAATGAIRYEADVIIRPPLLAR